MNLLARGFRRGTTPSNFRGQWESIATVLNSLGPPTRTSDGWQKIWSDLKFKVKKKIAIFVAESNATGRGVFKKTSLGPLDNTVANLLQYREQINPESAVQGVPNTEECGNVYSLDCLEMESPPTKSSNAVAPFSSVSSSSILSSTPTVLAASTASISTNNQTSSKKSESPTKDKHELPKWHSMDQARILTKISNSIRSLKRSQRDIKDIEAKILKIEIERSKREEEMHLTDMKIKRIELSIKEKELELLNRNAEMIQSIEKQNDQVPTDRSHIQTHKAIYKKEMFFLKLS